MAMHLGPSGGEALDLPGDNSEINVTPFVDVMLVLLIIFMVAAPLATVDVPVDLPSSNAPASERPQDPIFVSIRSNGDVFVGNDPVPDRALTGAVGALVTGSETPRIFIRGDENVRYGRLMEVMNILRRDGYTQIGLTAEDER